MSPTYSYFIAKVIVIIPAESLMRPFKKLSCGFDKFVWLSLLHASIFIVTVYEAVKMFDPNFYRNFII
jgi:hypothetical protein